MLYYSFLCVKKGCFMVSRGLIGRWAITSWRNSSGLTPNMATQKTQTRLDSSGV